LGTIKSSNLCAEIVEYTSPTETAVCNLGSIALSRFVREDKTYDFDSLRKYTEILAENLDKVIDRNYYPTKECATSNFRTRPIGMGVQGLADVFAKMGLAWTSESAKKLNREIFEHIYFAAISKSTQLARELPKNDAHIDSPASEGKLQYHLWEDEPITDLNWEWLENEVKVYGLRNSLSIALMPTASTSQILGNNECFEPFTSNLYVRHVLAGDFIVVNKYLVDDLSSKGLWNSELRTMIIANNGSIQNIDGIPEYIKERYKTAWEIPQKILINFSRDRAPFVCQSQSLNLFVADPTYARISSMHVYAWKQGLKTGCYYLRTKAVASAQKFTVEPPQCTTCSA
jgi:ribonucleoside-diphosphate reductase alpha chain